MRFDIDDLSVGAKINEGGQGTLFALRNGDAIAAKVGLPRVVYKKFKDPHSVAGLKLESLSKLRENLPVAERQHLDAVTVWPAAVVFDATNLAVGYVMQELPEGFWYVDPDGEESVREGQLLVMKDKLAEQLGLDIPSTHDRLAICLAMAEGYALFHRHNLVFGDLSGRNFAYRLVPDPDICFMDCDAIRKRGEQPAVPQGTTPMWDHPEKGGQNAATDRYKLGLFILRCLTPNEGSQNRDPRTAAVVLDPAGIALLTRAVDREPGNRTDATEWVAYLKQAVANAPRPKRVWKPPPAVKPTGIRGHRRPGNLAGMGMPVAAQPAKPRQKQGLRISPPPQPVAPAVRPGRGGINNWGAGGVGGTGATRLSIAALLVFVVFAIWSFSNNSSSSPTPAAPPVTAVPRSVPLLRLTNAQTGDHKTTAKLDSASSLEAQLGAISDLYVDGSVPLYGCSVGSDYFLSLSNECNGMDFVQRVGFILSSPPSGMKSTPLYRCAVIGDSTEQFESNSPDCEGQTKLGLLGYTTSEVALVRFRNETTGVHQSAITPPGAEWSSEQVLGYLAPAETPTTSGLYSCRAGEDYFSSVDAACEGQVVLHDLGLIYLKQPSQEAVPLYRCTMRTGTGHFDSNDFGCEGQRFEAQLGRLLRPVGY